MKIPTEQGVVGREMRVEREKDGQWRWYSFESGEMECGGQKQTTENRLLKTDYCECEWCQFLVVPKK